MNHQSSFSSSTGYSFWIFNFYQMSLSFVVLGQILHTDVVYLHSGQGFREAEKIKRLLLQYKYAKETYIYYSFLPNIMKIFTI